MRKALGTGALAAFAVALAVASPTGAADDGEKPAWGTIFAPGVPNPPPPSPLAGQVLQPTLVFPNASVVSSGCGLRTPGACGLTINGMSGTVLGAGVYWAVMTQGEPEATAGSVILTRNFPDPPASVTVTGTRIGFGPPPCWGGVDRISVFRGVVSSDIVTGNGSYTVRLLNNAGGTVSGVDPFSFSPPPEWEGASLVLLGTGTGTVIGYEQGIAGQTFLGGLISYTLAFPNGVQATGGPVIYTHIGADGKTGRGLDPLPGVANKVVTVNSTMISGPNSQYNDSMWSGSSARPLPQLWDNHAVDIAFLGAVPAGSTQLDVTENGVNDCLTPIVRIVEIH